MSSGKITVVISQAPGKNPAKRALEENLAASLLMESGIELSIVPHLYDLGPDHTGRLFLESIQGDMVVLAWLFPRAAYWLLDRDGIGGTEGQSPLHPLVPKDEDEDEEPTVKAPGIGSAIGGPNRTIWCLDLRDHAGHQVYLAEIRRISAEVALLRQARQAQKQANQPVAIITLGLPTQKAAPEFTPENLLEAPGRRWYPVIDYSRCTNCLECLDFCLFGVYGVDGLDRILVENQDSCKKGCPACSRVCPEQAIIFPDYKSPAIAGAPVGNISGLKIDLSKLFGGEDAMVVAAKERDRELVRDGREAVGQTVGIARRQADKPSGPKDDLDSLLDTLDSLDI
ncbi:MAG: ferredoxin family protein [Planctomycetota bacterium]|nr:ferredoxin family protein [Planctomycetota bacterium]